MAIEFPSVESRLKRNIYQLKREVEDRLHSDAATDQDSVDFILLTTLLQVMEGYYNVLSIKQTK